MGLETVVRPVVFPDIRPPPARTTPIMDAPDKGLAVITGGSNNLVDMPYSEQHSWSSSRKVEVKRTYDKARMYWTRQDGTIDYNNYWEFEVLRSIEFIENGKTTWGPQQYSSLPTADNIAVTEQGLTRWSTSPVVI